jgi:hypothetical protein
VGFVWASPLPRLVGPLPLHRLVSRRPLPPDWPAARCRAAPGLASAARTPSSPISFRPRGFSPPRRFPPPRALRGIAPRCDGYPLRPEVAGLLHPAADPGVRCVSRSASSPRSRRIRRPDVRVPLSAARAALADCSDAVRPLEEAPSLAAVLRHRSRCPLGVGSCPASTARVPLPTFRLVSAPRDRHLQGFAPRSSAVTPPPFRVGGALSFLGFVPSEVPHARCLSRDSRRRRWSSFLTCARAPFRKAPPRTMGQHTLPNQANLIWRRVHLEPEAARLASGRRVLPVSGGIPLMVRAFDEQARRRAPRESVRSRSSRCSRRYRRGPRGPPWGVRR